MNKMDAILFDKDVEDTEAMRKFLSAVNELIESLKREIEK